MLAAQALVAMMSLSHVTRPVSVVTVTSPVEFSDTGVFEDLDAEFESNAAETADEFGRLDERCGCFENSGSMGRSAVRRRASAVLRGTVRRQVYRRR